jgi:hypothetical protein
MNFKVYSLQDARIPSWSFRISVVAAQQDPTVEKSTRYATTLPLSTTL